jgi:hypothetical protein
MFSTSSVSAARLIKSIPDRTAVRNRLAHALLEDQILRQLLRLAERAVTDRRHEQIGKEVELHP